MGVVIMKRMALGVVALALSAGALATEPIKATAGARATAGAAAHADGGAGGAGGAGGSGGSGGAGSGGSVDLRHLGLAASVSNQTCYGSPLGGLLVWTQDACIRNIEFMQFVQVGAYTAAVEFMCQVERQAKALAAAGYTCKSKPDDGPKMPVFQTGAEGDHGYGPYKPFQQVPQQ